MKVGVRVESQSLQRAIRTAIRLRAELERELQLSAVAELDPEQRRDALERAVRRIWGATQ